MVPSGLGVGHPMDLVGAAPVPIIRLQLATGRRIQNRNSSILNRYDRCGRQLRGQLSDFRLTRSIPDFPELNARWPGR